MSAPTPAADADPQTKALMNAAEGGDSLAMLKLARICDLSGQAEAGLAWLQRAAEAGSLPALTAYGCRLAVGRAAPYQPAEGHAALRAAADKGFAEAHRYLAVFAAVGHGQPESWAEALELLARAAGLGDPGAAEQAELLRDLGVRTVADVGAWAGALAPQPLWESPRLTTAEAVVPPRLAQRLIDKARPKLAQARIHDAAQGGRRPDPMRTNTGMGFSLIETDLPLQLIRLRLAHLAGQPVAHQEALNVLHYAPGEQYAPHWDYLDPGAPALAEPLARLGQRVATVLVYLNDAYEGGETDFPQLGIQFRGRPGEALSFRNVGPDGAPDPRTLHAGLPPIRGEKWLLSQWVRDRPQPVA